MVAISVTNFKGMLPRHSPRLLPNNFASVATNAEITGGNVRGYRTLELIHTLPAPAESVFRVRPEAGGPDRWLSFNDVNAAVIRSPLANDSFDRYYWTEAGARPQYNSALRIAEGSSSYDLGIPRPTQQPSLTTINALALEGDAGEGGYLLEGGADEGVYLFEGSVANLMVTRAYTYAFVSSFGEIGPGADPIVADGFDGAVWVLSGIPETAPDSDNRDITRVNIYRTITSTSGVATYFYVDTMPIGSTEYRDCSPIRTVAQNEIYAGFDWLPPPETLQGIVAMPGGFLAGFSGADIFFSEPYNPHAWPAEYVLSVDYPIVGLAVHTNTLHVLTESTPYVMIGSRPENIVSQRGAGVEPCLSQRGIVVFTEGVYYPSQNGLVLSSVQGLTTATRSVIIRYQWLEDFSPSSIRAAKLGTKYLAIEGENEGFVLDPAEEGGSISNLSAVLGASNMQTDPWTGEVLLVAGVGVYIWDSVNTPRSRFTWKSKEFQLAEPVNFGAAMIHFVNARDCEFKLWADYELVYDGVVQSGVQFRLPSGFKRDVWQFEISCAGEVHSVAIAETGKELATV